MSAQDEAVVIIEQLLPTTCDCGFPHNQQLAERLLDALPDELLVQLTIERGALTYVTVGVGSPAGDLFIVETGESVHDDTELLQVAPR